MVSMSNGAGAPERFMAPPGPGQGAGMPPAPGEAPLLDMRAGATPPPPAEHRTAIRSGTAPPQVAYEGGGIFAASTYGPSEESMEKPEPARPAPRGTDFGPNMSAPMAGPPGHRPQGAPMTYGMMRPPMAAPGMPDVGAPPTHDGVFGATDDKGTLGLTLIAVAGGSLAGAYYGGGYGAVAGGLFGGAAVNAFRAFSHVKEGMPESDKEAAVSGTYAVGATVVAGVIWAKLVEPRGATANPKRDKNDDTSWDNSDDCDIRPVGP